MKSPCVTRKQHSPNLSYPRTGKRGVPQQFPRKLYEMLEAETPSDSQASFFSNSDEKIRESNPIIEWSESGRAFRIGDISMFAEHVLPKYFRTNKFSSFQRNLNLYGFTKVRKGPDTDMYAHPSFSRGYPQALSQLRKSTNTTSSSVSTSQKSSSSSASTSNSSLTSSTMSMSSPSSSFSDDSSSPNCAIPEPFSQLIRKSSQRRKYNISRPSFEEESRHLSQQENWNHQLTPSSQNASRISRDATQIKQSHYENTYLPRYENHQYNYTEQVENSQPMSLSNINHSSSFPLKNSGCYPKGGKLALLTIALTAIGDSE